MLRQFPIAGFIVLALAVLLTAFMATYVWLASNLFWGLLVVLAAVGVIVLVARWRRPPVA